MRQRKSRRAVQLAGAAGNLWDDIDEQPGDRNYKDEWPSNETMEMKVETHRKRWVVQDD